jgi:hypothetical protein
VLRLRSQIILRDFLEGAVIFETSNERAQEGSGSTR